MNKRRHPRFDVDHPATLNYSGRDFPCKVLNFSVGGLFLDCEEMETVTQIRQMETDEGAALITLEGQPYRVEVGIAFLGKTGLGVFFQHSETELFSYLKACREGGARLPEARPTVEDSKVSRETLNDLLNTLNKKTISYLAQRMARFPVIASEDLISGTDEIMDTYERSALYLAATKLEEEGDRIAKELCGTVRSAITKLRSAKIGGSNIKNSADQKLDELELVDKDDFDQWIKLNDLANHYEMAMGEVFSRFHLALSNLLQHLVAGENSPFSPLSLLMEFNRAISGLTFPPQPE